MKAGTILFNGADLALYGAPRFTLKRSPEPAAPARATHRRVEISVTVELRAEMPATVWARARALSTLLSSTAEGLLEIRDENGGSVSWLAVPGENGLPQALERRGGRVEMNFTAIEAVAEGDFPLAMTIDPLDGSPPLTIARPGDWSQNTRISRPDSRLAQRDMIASTVSFTARTAFADGTLATAARAEQLLTEAERLEALAGKEVRLTFAGFDRTVQVEGFTAKPSAGWEWIDLEAQVRFVVLPGETEAEVTFTADSQEDPATGETRTTVSGSVEAPDKLTAHTKVDAILAAYRTAARRVVKISKKDAWLDGEDSAEPEWAGLEFSIELAEGTDQTRYTLKVDTREAANGRQVVYSGTAYAATLSGLLATIASAAAGKHPVETGSEISVDYATDDEGTLKLIQGSFSYQYAVAATVIRGTATLGKNQGSFGDWQTSVSGSISAPDYAQARAVARSFIPAGVILRADDENEEKAFTATASPITVTEQLVTLGFSYSWGSDHSHTSMQYEDSSNPDYTRMVETREITGTAWAASRADAESAVTALLAGLSLTNPSAQNFTHSHERQVAGATTTDRWLSFKFSYTFHAALTGTIGHDIIEAQFSIQRIGQVDHIPMTEIPLGMPVTQLSGGTMAVNPVGFGHNIGRLVASGSVKARLQATARTWGQAKRASAASTGGHYGAADPPDEAMTPIYLPFNGSTATCYEFRFQYGFRYAGGLTGLWPSSGLTV